MAGVQSTHSVNNSSSPSNPGVMRRRQSKMTTSAMEKEGITPLMLSCQQGQVLDVQRILRLKKNAIREQTRSKKVALHYCAEGGNVQCLELIFEAAPAMLNAQDEEGYTPLHYSVINGNKDAVRTLIDFQADVNCLDNEGHSLIHWAVVCGELEILDILLKSGAPAGTPDIHHAHPIHYAAQMCGSVSSSDVQTARVQSTVYGVSPKRGLAILRRLLQHRVPIDVKDQDGRQPLLWAASAGSADAILALVNGGAAVDGEDKDGLTALHCAASRGHVDCIETLIGLCGSEVDVIDNNGCTALFYAVTLGKADCTELLLNFGAEPNRQDRKGRTPAHCGCSKGQLETIKLFAKHGGNLWLRNVRGDLPLHEAVLSRRKDLVMWLLSQRPDTVNATNNDGRCPIHLAALNNNVEMVKILIDHHAEVNGLMRTGKGTAMTPLDAAIHRGNAAVAKFLQLHGSLPANSLNDSSLQRRVNRSVESQARTISSLRGSQLGSHNEFSPEDLRQLHNLTSPEAVHEPNNIQRAPSRAKPTSVAQYASEVAETILKEGPYIASITPINMDDGVQTDSSFYLRDSQVQVSEDFSTNEQMTSQQRFSPVASAIGENEILSSSRNNNGTLRSSTSTSSSSKSGKKLRKKKSALLKEVNAASTESEAEELSKTKRSLSKSSIHSRKSKKGSNGSSKTTSPEQINGGSPNVAEELSKTKRSLSKSSTHSRKSKKGSNGSSKSVSPEQQVNGSPNEVEATKEEQSQDQTTTTTSNTLEDANKKEQEQGEQTSPETSNESEKFSELENVAAPSSGESETRGEELGIIEEDSNGDLTKAGADITNDEFVKRIIDVEEQVMEETITRSKSSLTYENKSRQSSGRASKKNIIKDDKEINESKDENETRSKSEGSTTGGRKSSARLSTRKSGVGSAGSTRSVRSDKKVGTGSRPPSRIPRPASKQTENDSRAGSRLSKKEATFVVQTAEVIAGTPSQSIKRFPSPVSFISVPSQDDEGTDHEEMIVIESIHDELNLQEAAAARRRKSDTKSMSNKSKMSTPTTSAHSAASSKTRVSVKPTSRKSSMYTSSGKFVSKKKSSPIMDKEIKSKPIEPGKRGQQKVVSIENEQAKSVQSEEEIRLQEELLALSKSRETTKTSKLPLNQRRQNKGISASEKKVGKNESLTVNGKGGDSGYSDQMIHTTSASEDQTRLRQQFPKSNSTGALVRRNRRPGSSSSAKIIARQQRLVSPKKGRSTARERKRYEGSRKSFLSERDDDGLDGSVEDETTSHGGSGSLTSAEGYRRRQISKRKMASRTKFTFSAGDDVTNGRISPKPKNLDVDTPISVTQAMQASMRKYNIERKIFQELLELKRLQIRSGKANEQVLVKRLADTYNKEGFTVNFREYDGPYTYVNFEKYLYDQLRLLQTNRKLLPRFAPSDDLEKLSTALKKMNATKLPYLLDDFEQSETLCDNANCTHLTHRCHHAAHAYTGIPCAAYIGASRKMGFLPQVDTHKAPGPVQKSISPANLSTGLPFTPSPGMTMIVSPRRADTSSPITLEVQQGDKTQIFSLPSQSLDPTKNYYVSLSIKPSPSPPIPTPTPVKEKLSNNKNISQSNANNKKNTSNKSNNNPTPKPKTSTNAPNQSQKKTETPNQIDRNVDDSLGSLIISNGVPPNNLANGVHNDIKV